MAGIDTVRFFRNHCATSGPRQCLPRYKAWTVMRGRRDGNLLLHFRKEIHIVDSKVDNDNPVAKYTSLCKGYFSILLISTPDV